MQKGIHPEYMDCVIVCGCGEVIHTRATVAKIAVEICSKCHPFYTGKQKFVDTAGRVEKFQRRYNWGKKEKEEEAPQEAPAPSTPVPETAAAGAAPATPSSSS